MGTVYYLVREDNHTLFELGKAYGYASAFREAYGHVEPRRVTSSEASALFAGLSGNYPEHAEIARRIECFADGQLLALCSEMNGPIDDYPDGPYRVPGGALRIVDSVFSGDWERSQGRPLWQVWAEAEDEP